MEGLMMVVLGESCALKMEPRRRTRGRRKERGGGGGGGGGRRRRGTLVKVEKRNSLVDWFRPVASYITVIDGSLFIPGGLTRNRPSATNQKPGKKKFQETVTCLSPHPPPPTPPHSSTNQAGSIIHCNATSNATSGSKLLPSVCWASAGRLLGVCLASAASQRASTRVNRPVNRSIDVASLPEVYQRSTKGLPRVKEDR